MSSLLAMKDVFFRYQDEAPWTLQAMNVTVEKGEWLTIVGRNGSGKSTFAKLLNGLLLPTEGEVIVDGCNTKNEQALFPIRQRVGMVFQNPDNQFVATTVEDDIAFGLENMGIEPDEMKARIEKYASLTGTQHLLKEEPHRLSGGQKQRVAIAGVAAMEPELIVFDEATSMLDPSGREEVLTTIKNLQQQGSAIVTITHYMEEALQSDRVVLIQEGQVMVDEDPLSFFEKTDRIREAGLTVPPLIALQHQLRERGIPLQRLFLKEEELMEQLWILSSTT
ncbi:energy-coupling factor transporter ATPase [Halalkalibacter hemicellulosilyticus]|uniref:ATPase component of general energizing module of ECF transporters n=1 Tax=Halalkalibacter hemicellulosilyticusJCM 9152 TaxID=1236971 RepID=W4QHE3_9BACI|nr:energy-coupling factor transporter ATPase [Halalkalibacter hemicellulosilyticus]GAE31520.1 ATPase component of general energizing module of ECF transporters [Halalkalibacter hemicellulosilyticusJCM 9152]